MKRTLLFLAVSSLLAGGCASTSDVKVLQSQIADLQQELVNVKQTASSKSEMEGVNRTIAQQTQMLLSSNATLVTKVDRIEEAVQSAQNAVEQIGNRVDRLVLQIEQAQREIEELKAAARASAAPIPAAGGVNPVPPMGEVNVTPPPSTTADPVETYQAAMRDYQKGNYDLAISGFRDFLTQNGTSDLADNAAYWIGESLFSQKKYREAIEQFDSVVTRYPRSDKVPGALLKKGISHINLGERAQGVVQLQYVVHEHPKSQEATLARQRLKALGVETK
jgi:tol-pal system protein YbgF